MKLIIIFSHECDIVDQWMSQLLFCRCHICKRTFLEFDNTAIQNSLLGHIKILYLAFNTSVNRGLWPVKVLFNSIYKFKRLVLSSLVPVLFHSPPVWKWKRGLDEAKCSKPKPCTVSAHPTVSPPQPNPHPTIKHHSMYPLVNFVCAVICCNAKMLLLMRSSLSDSESP